MNQVLSQDEVDALLQGISGESQKLDPEEQSADGIRDYNLANQERIVRGRMPTMEIIMERFARNIRIGLFNLIPVPPLDGGNVLAGLLPDRAADLFVQMRPFGFLILYGLMFTGMLSAMILPPAIFLIGLLGP